MAGRTRLVLLDARAVFAASINRPDGSGIHHREAEVLTFRARRGLVYIGGYDFVLNRCGAMPIPAAIAHDANVEVLGKAGGTSSEIAHGLSA